MITEVGLILATIAGPVVAVQTQKIIERATARKQGQRRVFDMLMATRATRVSSEHVQALNAIDIQFRGSGWRTPTAREREVLRRWRIYADHLGIKIDENDNAAIRLWNITGDDLFTDVLEAMAKALGYNFDRVELKRGVYWPKAHGDAEIRQRFIEGTLANVLTGQTPLSLKVVEFPASDEAIELQNEVHRAILKVVSPDGRLQVKTNPDRPQGPFAEAAE